MGNNITARQMAAALMIALIVLFGVFVILVVTQSTRNGETAVIENVNKTGKVYLDNVIITKHMKVQKFCDGDHLVYITSGGDLDVVPYGCRD